MIEEVGVVFAEPGGRGHIGDVDLEIAIGGDQQGSRPLLGFVHDLRWLAEGTALDDLLTEAYSGKEQEKQRCRFESLKGMPSTRVHGCLFLPLREYTESLRLSIVQKTSYSIQSS